MKYEWLDGHLLGKMGAVKDFKMEWDATRYMVGGKMFCMIGGDKQGKPIVTLKCDPPYGAILRQEYLDIVPGYYMNKEHWNSVYLEGEVPDDVVRQMADMSYSIIFEGLSKKAKEQIKKGEQE